MYMHECVCLHLYICLCGFYVYKCVYVICAYIYVCVYACVCVSVSMCLCICVMCLCVWLSMCCSCFYVCTCVYVYMHFQGPTLRISTCSLAASPPLSQAHLPLGLSCQAHVVLGSCCPVLLWESSPQIASICTVVPLLCLGLRKRIPVCVRGMPVRRVRSLATAPRVETIEAELPLKSCAYRLNPSQ